MLLITDGLPRGLGYLEVDQRAVDAPLPPGTQRHQEADTYTCSHCGAVVVIDLMRKRERYNCNKWGTPSCNHHICDDCAARRQMGAACCTFAQFVEERLEAEARHLPAQSILLPWER